MSSTRTRTPGTPPKQTGYASSDEYDRGLYVNLVAQRSALLDSADERELLMAVQYLSHQPGGLTKLAAHLIAANPDRLATPSMIRHGFRKGQSYDAAKVRQVRAEIPNGEELFLLKGELSAFEQLGPVDDHSEAPRRPSSYPAERFATHCRAAALELEGYLSRLCLDPSLPVAGPWYFPGLLDALREHLAARAQQVRTRFAENAITRQIFEALDYTLTGDGITLIEGLARIGKTWAIKAYCDMWPGRLRYVQVPCTNDERSFVCSLAEAYGAASGSSRKTAQILESVRKAAHASKLGVVLDEGHYLISSDYRCRKRPTRIAWMMNELVNYGVPVAICVTPQFAADKERVRVRTGWSWEQFDGRIGYPLTLESVLPTEDLKAVARIHLPEVTADAILAVAKYAEASSSYVAGIEHIARRARHESKRAGRERVTMADIASAIRSRRALDGLSGNAAPSATISDNGNVARQRPAALQPASPSRSRVDDLQTLVPC